MSNGKFANSGVVVGQTRSSRRDQSLQHQKGAKVTMGSNAPRSGEGAVGDITVRTLTNKGFRAYIKTNSGWVDINSMTARESVEWIDMVLVNSWVRFHATSVILPQYCKDSNGFVHFRGTMKDGSSATANITTLPPGFRPPKPVICAGAHDGGQSSFQILADGTVNIENGGDTGRQELDGVSFFAQQGAAKGGGAGSGHTPDPGAGGHAPQ